MKFMLTASSISSIAISRMMTFLRLRKMPTTLIAKSSAPSTRKCASVSNVSPLSPSPVLLAVFGRHRHDPDAILALDRHLLRRVLVPRVLALAHGEGDRGDDRHQQDHRRQLE